MKDYADQVGGENIWGPIFRRNLSVMEDGQFCSLLTLIDDVYIPVEGKDLRIWSCSTDGCFSVASCF